MLPGMTPSLPGRIWIAPLRVTQTFCPDIRVREDYLPNDFTLYLYRETPS